MQEVRIHGHKVLLQYAREFMGDHFTPVEELIKNQIEKPSFAKKVFIETDQKACRIVVYGNGRGIGPKAFDEIFTNIADSSKSKENKGMGIIASFAMGPRLVAFSKLDSENCYIAICHLDPSDGRFLFHVEAFDKRSKYAWMKDKLSKFKSGTVWMIEDVGSSMVDKEVDMRFNFGSQDMTKVIDQLKKYLSNTFMWDLGDLFSLTFNGKALKPNTKKLWGKKIEIPTVEGTVSYLDTDYKVKVEFRLFTYPGMVNFSYGGTSVDLREDTSFQYNIRKSGVFAATDELGHNLTGKVKLSVTEGEAPDLSTGTRRSFQWTSNFGQFVINALLKAQEDYIRPAITEYRSKKVTKKYDNLSHSLSVALEACLNDPELESQYPPEYNTNVTDKYRLRCKNCGGTKLKPVGDQWFCKTCGHSWTHIFRARTGPIAPPPHRKPHDHDDKTKIKVPGFREKLHGKGGMTIKIQADFETDAGAYCIGSIVFVNASHPLFQEAEQKSPAAHKAYVVNVALTAFEHERSKGNPTQEYDRLVRLLGIFMARYFDQVSLSKMKEAAEPKAAAA